MGFWLAIFVQFMFFIAKVINSWQFLNGIILSSSLGRETGSGCAKPAAR